MSADKVILHRFEAKVYGSDDDARVELKHTRYQIERETRCGYWIVAYGHRGKSWAKKRFVLKTSKKRYAYPTESEAMESLKARSRMRVQYARAALEDAEAIMKFLNEQEQKQ